MSHAIGVNQQSIMSPWPDDPTTSALNLIQKRFNHFRLLQMFWRGQLFYKGNIKKRILLRLCDSRNNIRKYRVATLLSDFSVSIQINRRYTGSSSLLIITTHKCTKSTILPCYIYLQLWQIIYRIICLFKNFRH